MEEQGKDRRRHTRYKSETQVFFNVTFDFRTKINYQVVFQGKPRILSKKYPGLSKDFSAEGVCFVSSQNLEPGDLLYLEVHLARRKKVIPMEGVVRWSQRCPQPGSNGEILYETGVKLKRVNKKVVLDTIRYDKTNKVVWSNVLESLLGGFKKLGGGEK